MKLMDFRFKQEMSSTSHICRESESTCHYCVQYGSTEYSPSVLMYARRFLSSDLVLVNEGSLTGYGVLPYIRTKARQGKDQQARRFFLGPTGVLEQRLLMTP